MLLLTKASNSFVQPSANLIKLADKLAPRWRARFLAVIKTIKDQLTLKKVEELLSLGMIEEALVLSETAALQLGRLWGETFTLGADETAKLVADALNITIAYDVVNERALAEIRRNTLRLIRQFTDKQRLATREALQEGIRRGINPRDMAREFRGSIGLTENQVRAVNNYRRMLEELDSTALQRALRDKRFDRTVLRSIEEGRPLSQQQINTMTERYRSRYLKYRSEVISRTESLRAVHAGTDEMYQQAFDSGTLRPDAVIRQWDTSKDSRVRSSHRSMEGQRRLVGQPFITGLGNSMRYPGDPEAPPADSIQDRCAVTTRYKAPQVFKNFLYFFLKLLYNYARSYAKI